MVQSAAFALSNLTRGGEVFGDELLQAGIVRHLINLLDPRNNSLDVAFEVAWVVSYLTSSPDYVPEFVSGGVINILVDTLYVLAQETPHNSEAVTPMLRSLGESEMGIINMITSLPLASEQCMINQRLSLKMIHIKHFITLHVFLSTDRPCCG